MRRQVGTVSVEAAVFIAFVAVVIAVVVAVLVEGRGAVASVVAVALALVLVVMAVATKDDVLATVIATVVVMGKGYCNSNQ